MIERFKQVGIYRAATPKCFGGDALVPARFLQMIERISEADGSAGWVASFGSAGVYLAALPKETLSEIYAQSPDLVFAGGLFPLQPAEAVEGGWQVNGTWKFASGC
jgi:alkylation response protein AidB-like acyl-CoA dehydrogenase